MKRKVVVITGASDGIGAAAARRLASDGHHVVVVGRSAGKTTAIARELATQYVCVAFPALDAKAQGFKVYAVMDASGDPSEFTSRIKLARLSQAGVVPTSAIAVMCEFQQHWNRPNNEEFAKLHTDVAPNYRAVIESFQTAQDVLKTTKDTETA